MAALIGGRPRLVGRAVLPAVRLVVPSRGRKFFVHPERFELTIVHTNGATIKSFTTNPLKPVWRPTTDAFNHPAWQQQWQPEVTEEAATKSEETAEMTEAQKAVLDKILKKQPKRRQL